MWTNARGRLARQIMLALCVIGCIPPALVAQGGPAGQQQGPAGGQGRAVSQQGQATQPQGPVDVVLRAPNVRLFGDPFPGQPRIRALMVAGGCCHDYAAQGAMMMKLFLADLPIDWTYMNVGGTAGSVVPSIYSDPNWFRGYDLVVHNECFTPADSLVSDSYLANAAAATRAGIPAVVIHCAMHTFRAEAQDQWRSVLGVHSVRHERAAPIAVKVVAPGHPIMDGIPAEWMTPVDELYVLERMLSGTVPLATGKSPADGREHAVAWVNETGARVFGITLGHGSDTWNDPVFQKLMMQGVHWALRR
jgi:uncharacterized protein